MKTIKRLATTIICGVVVLQTVPLRIQAMEVKDQKVIAAEQYIREKGLLHGTVVSSSTEDELIIMNVVYSTGREATYTYEELINGDIEVTIIEPHASDVILFTANGNVYVDSVMDDALTADNKYAEENIETYRGYVYTRYTTNPGWSGSYSSQGTTTDYVELTQEIRTHTSSYLAYKIAAALLLSGNWGWLFTEVATVIISKAVNAAITATGFTYYDTKYAYPITDPLISRYYVYEVFVISGITNSTNHYWEQRSIV